MKKSMQEQTINRTVGLGKEKENGNKVGTRRSALLVIIMSQGRQNKYYDCCIVNHVTDTVLLVELSRPYTINITKLVRMSSSCVWVLSQFCQ